MASGPDAPDTVSTSAEEYGTTMKNYAILIEYKHLKEEVPAGVFVMPSLNDVRLWHGAIFVKRGPFEGGVLRFRFQLPADYPTRGASPRITFTSQVFHPYVDPRTGELDLPPPDPDAMACVVPALWHLRKAIYDCKGLDENEAAFMERASGCALLSRKKVYENEEGSTLRFSSPTAQHDLHEATGRRLDEVSRRELPQARSGSEAIAQRAAGGAGAAATPSPSAVPASAVARATAEERAGPSAAQRNLVESLDAARS